MATKTSAVIELGYNTKIVVPIAKLSALMSILEHASIVNDERISTDFTGELDSVGNPICDYKAYWVESSSDITAKIVPTPSILPSAVAQRMRDDADKAREEALRNVDESHPFRLKTGDNNYFLDARFRTEIEAAEYGRQNWQGKRKGFTVYEGNEPASIHEASETD